MLTRKEVRVIFTVTIGGFLEWYEFFLYAYFAPTFAHSFFPKSSESSAILSVLVIFAVGFLSRPLGAVFFGYVGDRFGRRLAFLSSIILITIPTFVIGLLPPYSEIGLLAPLTLLLMRLFQGMLVGGEVPGSICYLVESAPPERRRFMGSWTFFGSQLGALFAVLESLFLEKHLGHDVLAEWGWRISFFAGGAIGLLAFFLRRALKETEVFQELAKKQKISRSPIAEALHLHKKCLFWGFCVSAIPLAGFFVLFIFSPIYFERILGMTPEKSLLLVAGALFLSTTFLPVFGKIGLKYSSKKLLTWSSYAILLFTYPFYLAATSGALFWTLISGASLVLATTLFYAVFPQYLAELFPPPVRFSCVGLSYNLSSSMMGGITPYLSFFLINATGIATMPAAVLLVVGFISLWAIGQCKCK